MGPDDRRPPGGGDGEEPPRAPEAPSPGAAGAGEGAAGSSGPDPAAGSSERDGSLGEEDGLGAADLTGDEPPIEGDGQAGATEDEAGDPTDDADAETGGGALLPQGDDDDDDLQEGDGARLEHRPDGVDEGDWPSPAESVRQVVQGITAGGDVTVNMQVASSEFDDAVRAAEQYVLEPLPEKTMLKMAGVYVRPDSLEGTERQLRVFRGTGESDDSGASRVLLVQGAEHAGKLASSVAMTAALVVKAGLHLIVYQRKPHETGSLLEVVHSTQWSESSLVLLEDAFAKNVRLGELEGAELDQLTAALKAKKSFLLLTTELGSEALKLVEAPKVSVEVSRLWDILVKHLAYYCTAAAVHRQQLEDAAKASWVRLQELLRTPFHVDRFCAQLAMLSGPEPAQLEALARAIGLDDPKALQPWFDGLGSNEKLVAMLLYLFEGLNAASLEELAKQAVGRLRQEGFVWVLDPRELGFKSLLETIRASGERGAIAFEDDAVKGQVAWQTGNRQALLWSVFEPIIAETATTPMWSDPVRRAALGIAVGRMGVSDRKRFGGALELWARSRSSLPRGKADAIGSLPGIALAEALRRAPDGEAGRVLERIGSWISSRDPDLLWAAGAAIWRIYDVVLARAAEPSTQATVEALKRLLRELVRASYGLASATRRRVDREVRSLKLDGAKARTEVGRRLNSLGNHIRAGAVFAIDRIGRANLSEMVALLLEWLERDPAPKQLRWVIFVAAEKTFKGLRALEVEPNREKYAPLLGLIGRILAAAPGTSDVCQALSRWLAAWLRWETWLRAISAVLLDVANRGSDRARAAMRDALALVWLEAGSPAAEAIARAVIGRSYAMEGILTDRPALGRCLLALDPALLASPAPGAPPDVAKKALLRQGNVRRLQAALEAQMEVVVVILGSEAGREPGAEEPGEGEVASRHGGHRLLMPAAEAAAAKGVRLVLVVTTGPVVDLDDALDALGAADKLVVAAGCDVGAPAGVAILRVGPGLEAADVNAIEARLQALWAQALVQLQPGAWIPLLMDLGVRTADLEQVEASLDAWADSLAEAAAASGRTDLAKRILGVLFWLAAGDFRRCLGIVKRWLTEGEATGLRRAMGTAAGKALFHAAAHARATGGRWAPLHLFDELAAPLSQSGQDGTDAVLRAVARWLEEPELAAGLAGGTEEGRGRLLRWAEVVVPQKVEDFRAALDRLRSALDGQDLGAAGEGLTSALDRWRYSLGAGRPRPLPPLREGQRYGVIVLDSADAEGADASRWTQLAGTLCRTFNGGQHEAVRPVLYRLGERWPIWVAGDGDPKDEDLIRLGVHLPRLLGPVLSSGLLARQVEFLLVLADTAWTDGEDWVAPPWRDLIITWRPLVDVPWGAVHPSLPQPWGTTPTEVDQAAQFLARRRTRSSGAQR